MNIEDFREYCLSLKGVMESFPFDDTTLVFKVRGRMFALTDLDGPFSINLKCDPDRAVSFRERYPCVHPGYHMNKKHWNTIMIDGSISDQELREWILHSYRLVTDNLPKKIREELGSL
ncbi:MAG: MmcQ/YjbR family DNA-binding protein [Bacteroidales bacterium]|nr:MmcQ/YjbR family DNA-binding protein [Bacteroidales bacterium]